ncbi:Ig-like domain-containing protein [Subtercola vilae]|uniref:Uncharacterized protein n=1 Tax=Subtercola vilae TaxID=2056433 RepID=A0A4T2BEX9_9MICO|nr:Ig-like domain-containing protein [Subtercola vilae]TIH28782.1 hypothetical protein D4765_18260 [Subtercola vilae]
MNNQIIHNQGEPCERPPESKRRPHKWRRSAVTFLVAACMTIAASSVPAAMADSLPHPSSTDAWVATTTAEILGSDGEVIASVDSSQNDSNTVHTIDGVDAHAAASSDLKVRTTGTVRFLNATEGTMSGDKQYRFAAPEINAGVVVSGGFTAPDNAAVSCDVDPNQIFHSGDTVDFSCTATATAPEYTLDTLRQEMADNCPTTTKCDPISFDEAGNPIFQSWYFSGLLVPLKTSMQIEWAATGFEPTYWNDGTRLEANMTEFMVDVPGAQTWLPVAQDQSYRVKADDVLTVTPDGLLTGAQWSQGTVSSLDTHITNVPAGGTVEANGDLTFTSDQIGGYQFKYFLEDPSTELRSADASGAIEVYADSTTPPTATPDPTPTPTPVVTPKPTPPAPVVTPTPTPAVVPDPVTPEIHLPVVSG